jgi:tetratricopeptide (TPR) repeat protein
MSEMNGELGSAIAAHKAGRIDEAEAGYRRVLAGRPGSAEAHFMLGLVHLQKNRPSEAEESLRQAIAIDPADARFHNNLGKALMGQARADEALAAFDSALDLAAELENARFGRGAALMALGRAAEAEETFRAILARRPGDADALVNVSVLLIKQNRNAEAAEILRGGLARHPRDPRLLANLANALEKLNDLAGAEAAARQAVEAAPQLTEPRFSLARLDHRRGRLPEARARLESLLDLPLRAEERLDVLFELGAVLDRMGEPAAAMAAFARAKREIGASPAARAFSGARFLDRVARCRAWFTRERLNAMAAGGAAADGTVAGRRGPVFFVGFPRSGTTLMERVLQAHPGLATTEEDSPLAPVRRHLALKGGYPEALAHMAPGDLDEARRLFWSAAEATAGPLDGRLLVDKLPLNIVDLGLANALFPGARVLVALRDPRDVCLSCYMQYFLLNDAMVNFLDLRQTARTYAAVMELWLHYREVLTVPYREYRYEDLVEDFDGVVRQVLEFLGVGWHDDVARYRDKSLGRAIGTPSYRNVTDALYSRSVGRWRAYRRQLSPVLDPLKPFAASFGYPED